MSRIISNFDVHASIPLDSRLVVEDAIARDAIAFKYEGMSVYVKSEGVMYCYTGSNGWINLPSATASEDGSIIRWDVQNEKWISDTRMIVKDFSTPTDTYFSIVHSDDYSIAFPGIKGVALTGYNVNVDTESFISVFDDDTDAPISVVGTFSNGVSVNYVQTNSAGVTVYSEDLTLSSIVQFNFSPSGLHIGQSAEISSEYLEIDGRIVISDSSNNNPLAGAIRWNGSNFQGYEGSDWVDLDYSISDGSVEGSFLIWDNSNSIWIETSNVIYNASTNSFSWGGTSNADFDYGTAWGNSNFSNAVGTTVFGINNESDSIYDTIWGSTNISTGSGYNTLWGANNSVDGQYNTVLGANNTTTGNHNFTGGTFNQTDGNRGFSFGTLNIITSTSTNGFVFGRENLVDGENCTVWGFDNTSSGDYSTTFGVGNVSPSYAETTLGHYATTYVQNSIGSISNLDRLVTFGNGSSINSRSDATIVWKSGYHEFNGTVKLGNTTVGEGSTPVNGQIRWNGTNFQGYKSGNWLNLDGNSPNIVVVESVNDLPTPVGNVITLEAKSYLIVGDVDLVGNRLSIGLNADIVGTSTSRSSLTSTGLPISEPLITVTSASMKLRDLVIKDVDTLFDINSTNSFDWISVNILNIPNLGTIKNVSNIFLEKFFVNNCANLIFDGTIDTISIRESIFSSNGTSQNIRFLDTLTINRRIRILFSSFLNTSSNASIFADLNLSIPDENYIILNCNFSGGGTYISGLGESSNKSLFKNNVGISNTSVIAQMYMSGNSIQTNINTQNVWVKVSGTTTSGYVSKYSVSTSNRMTNNATVLRRFLIQLSNFSFTTSSNNQEIQVGIFDSKINAIRTPSITTSNAGNAGRSDFISSGCLIEHSSGDYIEIWVRNLSSGTGLTVRSMNVIITEI